jgi:hypothetical protein
LSTKELVGPLRRVHFSGRAAHAFDLPADTLDPRYAACVEHRTACDCREAMFAEDRAELSGELRGIKTALAVVLGDTLKGHPTFGRLDEDDFMAETGPVCRCAGCVIARTLYRDHHISVRTPWDQYRETSGGGS